MDRSDPQVAAFIAALAGVDDETLAALANKGLVRRARKDLDKNPPAIISAEAAFVSLRVEDATVTLTQPAAKSTCSCASGVCRHILAGLIWLREAGASIPPAAAAPIQPTAATGTASPAAPASTDPAEPLLSFDAIMLQKWAGKPLLKRAGLVLSRGYQIEQAPAAIVVRLPALNLSVRCMAGGLDAMICSCHAPGPCEHKVAAVLAIQAQSSATPVQVAPSALQESTGAPRSRQQVRQSVKELLGQIISMGLSRLSTASESRLRTLSTSAHGVDLPRLSRMLRSLADEISMTLLRDASAASSSLLASCARLWALCDALEHPTATLVGEHRSLYMPVAGSMEVVGLGARRWRTPSGYHGLTVFLWEPSSRRWTTWNDARPLATPGFDPVRRFDEGGPWSGAASPRQAAGTSWRLSGIHRNAAGRLTARDNSRGIPGRPSRPEDGPLITDFSQLGPMAAEAFAPGLRQRTDHGDLVLLAPAQCGPPEYDAIQQEVLRPLADANGKLAILKLRHSPESEHALTTLQTMDGPTVKAVLASLRIGEQGLFVEPITLWTAEKPIHLTLDGAPPAAQQSAAAAASDASEEDEETQEEPPMLEASAVGHLLVLGENELTAIAESGIAVIRDLSPLAAVARELSSLGISTAAGAIERLSNELENYRKRIDRNPAEPARRLLEAAYIIHLAGACQTISVAAR